MTATLDEATPRAAFGEALVQQTIDTLAEWLVKDGAVPDGTKPSDAAQFLALYYLMTIAGRRQGQAGVAYLLESAREIAAQAGVGE